MNRMCVNKICGSTNDIHKQTTDVKACKHTVVRLAVTDDNMMLEDTRLAGPC